MNAAINELPVWARVLAYGILVLGLAFVVGFITEYSIRMHWQGDPIGRHLVAMSANVGAFFLLYLLLGAWPNLPAENYIKLGLLVLIVTNSGIRWALFRKEYRAANK